MAAGSGRSDNTGPAAIPANAKGGCMTFSAILLLALAADFVELGGGAPLTTNRPYCGS